MANSEFKTTSIKLPKDILIEAKDYALHHDKKLNDIFVEAITAYLRDHK